MRAEYEVRVAEHRRTGERYVRYLDIVIQRRHSDGAITKIWVLELKNRQAQYLDPSSFPRSAALPTDRQPTPSEVAAAVARLTIDELAQIRVAKHDRWYAGRSVSDIVEREASEQLMSYVRALKAEPSLKQTPAAAVIACSVMFVAGRRYVFKKHVIG